MERFYTRLPDKPKPFMAGVAHVEICLSSGATVIALTLALTLLGRS
jgi:hypothetical protein